MRSLVSMFAMLGGAELVIVLFVMLFGLLLAAGIVLGVVWLQRRNTPRDLEGRIEALERALRELQDQKK